MLLLTQLVFLNLISSCISSRRPLVIGHRGSGYLPELTLETQAIGHGYGADLVEIDINLSRDNQLIVIHDLYLDAISNVAELYSNRNRSDGYHYLIDFDLKELKNLTVHERVVPFTNKQQYPDRFPSTSKVGFQLATLNETLEFLLALRFSTSRPYQLLIEIKTPEFYHNINRPISSILLNTLAAYNLTKFDDPVMIQTFFIEELFFIRQNLSSRLRLVALLSWNWMNESSSDYDYYRSDIGLKELSKVVQAIAPNMELVANFDSNGSIISPTNLTKMAHQYDLDVYPWTFRRDTYKGDFNKLIDYFQHEIGVDGFIGSQPDLLIELLTKQRSISSSAINRIVPLLTYAVVFLNFLCRK